MASVHSERLDHWGWRAAVIKDFGLIDMLDARLTPDAQEASTPGAAVAGMIRKGWGCAQRPLSLTPQCFANQPLDLWCHEGVQAEMFNRCQRGRPRDEAHAYGGDLLLNERALAVWAHEGIASPCNHLDTTSCALRGESVPDSDEHAIRMTPGSSKDHRPDVQQAVLELMVSQDGGVPGVRKRGDGQAAETQICRERAEARLATVPSSPTPRSWGADATRDAEDTAAHLRPCGCLTRLPHTLNLVVQVIPHALTGDTWPRLEEPTG